MPDKDSMELFYDEIARMLEMTKKGFKKTSKENIPADIHKKLADIKQAVELFEKLNDILINSSGVEPAKIDNRIKNTKSAPLREQDLLERSKILQKEVSSIHKMLEERSQTIKALEKAQGTGGATRKKKFGRIGSDKWKKI